MDSSKLEKRSPQTRTLIFQVNLVPQTFFSEAKAMPKAD